ncbi:DNA damage-regulated autophagy modulator protein [Blomia tropicalis]|nr:DNA damage-regulated autophagy modulator protein [Blomia tropicalis]
MTKTNSIVNVNIPDQIICDNTCSNEQKQCHLKNRLYRSIKTHLWIFPLVAAFYAPSFCFLIYFAALYQKQVEPFFPYVSDTGTLPPQASFFSQFLDLGILLAFIYYTKYDLRLQKWENRSCINEKNDKQVVQTTSTIRILNCWNFHALLVSMIASLTMMGVANFRSSELNLIHSIAAFSSFTSVYVYAWYMVKICNRLSQFEIETKPTSLTIFTIIGTISLLCCAICTVTNNILFREKITDSYSRMNWKSNEPGYVIHLFATITEWILINISSLLTLCFYSRFRKFNDWPMVKFFS